MKKSNVNIIMLFTLVISGFLGTIPRAQSKDILLINSYNADYGWSKECLTGLGNSMSPSHRVRYIEFNGKHLSDGEIATQAKQAVAEINRQRPDVIVLMDDIATRALGDEVANRGIPSVFLGINGNPREYFTQGIPPTQWGLLDRPLIFRSLTMLSETLPTPPKRVAVIIDTSETGSSIINESMGGHKKAVIQGISIDLIISGLWEDWQTYIRMLKAAGYDALFLGVPGNLRFADGTPITAQDAMRWLSENSPIPTFAFWSFMVGPDKMSGGYVSDGEKHCAQAGELVNEIAQTKTFLVSKIIRVSTGTYVFSRSQVTKWGLRIPDSIARVAKFTD